MSVSALLGVYVLGGLTFIPLVLCIAFLHAYITLPVRDDKSDISVLDGDKSHEAALRNSTLSDSAFESLPDELKTRAHVPDVAAGYFAVCREYVPGGINGKPPERTTPAGAVVAAESPSVYQAMYRSIFDRNKTTSPSLESASGKSKKARNVFYVVLRLGILMLYDDSEQLEVRHVISLAHYKVDIYAGGDPVPEGELWIKRNCIRLTQRTQLDKNQSASDQKPFYLFSDNCSEKEDFYHAMLQSQDSRTEADMNPPRPLKFNTPDLVRLVQQLHASEENLHTRWINALIGRVFLALYKTDQVEQFMWNKITKKIARVPKPALISKISLQKVDMGTLPPFITNPKLRELTVDGDMTVEADVSYKGNFRVEISAIARIELGSRFKAREVTLVLATTLKKLEGHILLRIKPPPSNRLWITFESAPKMELSLEPIVSSRQITYGVILRAIESRLREVISETLVLPNWDDFPFKDTESNPFRGGIWTNDAKKEPTGSLEDLVEQEEEVHSDEHDSESEDSDTPASAPASLDGAKDSNTPTPPTLDSADTQTTGFSSAVDRPPAKPKAMRSSSFARASTPVVNTNAANASATKTELREHQQDAATTMKTISKSRTVSPAETPVGSPDNPSPMQTTENRRSTSPASFDVRREQDSEPGKPTKKVDSSATLPNLVPDSADPENTSHHVHAKSKSGSSLSLPRNIPGSQDKRQIFNQSLNTASAAAKAAKNWFATRQNADGPVSPFPKAGGASSREHVPHPQRQPSDDSAENAKDTHATVHTPVTPSSELQAPLGSPANPIGRGQLIPEAGIHPKQEKKNTTGWSVPSASTLANLTLTRRKPVALKPHQTQSQSQQSPSDSPHTDHDDNLEHRPPLPSRPTSSSQFARPKHERKTSVGTAAMGVRRKSGAVPLQQGLPSPGRMRERRNITGEGRGTDAAVFVVDTPVVEGAVPGGAGLRKKGSGESLGINDGTLINKGSAESVRGQIALDGSMKGAKRRGVENVDKGKERQSGEEGVFRVEVDGDGVS